MLGDNFVPRLVRHWSRSSSSSTTASADAATVVAAGIRRIREASFVLINARTHALVTCLCSTPSSLAQNRSLVENVVTAQYTSTQTSADLEPVCVSGEED